MDGVSAETGQLSGFTTWVKEVDSECEAMHWVIHRETLAMSLHGTQNLRL